MSLETVDNPNALKTDAIASGEIFLLAILLNRHHLSADLNIFCQGEKLLDGGSHGGEKTNGVPIIN